LAANLDSVAECTAAKRSVGGQPTLAGVLAYAAPVAGCYFFYIPMWSILPGIYAKYFGLSLTSVAAVVLLIRVFDGVSDLTVGYWSDRRRAAGGSRKPWVIIGGLGTLVTCYFLFLPPNPTTTTYYLVCSLAYFLTFAVGEIPHLTWGNELTLDYQQRAQVFGARNIMSKLGIAGFYALPLLPLFKSAEYTPQVLRAALVAGALVMVSTLTWALFVAPAGIAIKPVGQDSPRLLLQSIVRSKPLLLYFLAIVCGALGYGMWNGLLYIYLDSYLGIGRHVAIILLTGTVAATLTTPLWLRLVHRTSKSIAWAIGLSCFVVQLLWTFMMSPSNPWWLAFVPIFLANLCFTANDVAALSIMGDVVDYGTLKFGVDRGATYFAIFNLIFKVGLGIGGGSALGIAGLFGFSASEIVHSASSVFGLRLGFIVLPTCCALLSLLFALRTPINRRRHRIIQRRIESRLIRSGAKVSPLQQSVLCS
jgi:glycoside/pentoside/hexuronide:cation symporter, GPH family